MIVLKTRSPEALSQINLPGKLADMPQWKRFGFVVPNLFPFFFYYLDVSYVKLIHMLKLFYFILTERNLLCSNHTN